MCEMHADHDHDDSKAKTFQGVPGGTTFAVSDMTCGHCVGTVKAAIEKAVPGAKVAVDLDSHRVSVAGDAKAAAAAIRAAGYTPELVAG
jgi:copper chaperone